MNQTPLFDATSPGSSLDDRYAERLVRKQTAWWKRLLDVQAPYRWNLRRLRPGFTLDVGCGIGRNLVHLAGQSIGVDPNEHAVAAARARGLPAYTPEEFRRSEYCRPERFDTLLLAHVCEHLSVAEARQVLGEYLPLVRGGGRAILITPQEVGYRSDPTHVRFVDFAALRELIEQAGMTVEQSYSFPFPRGVGRVFTYNEFVVVASKPT
jgi:SAM-dependent methyltransferase